VGADARWAGAQVDTPQNSAVQTVLSTDNFQAPCLPSPAPPPRRRFLKRLVPLFSSYSTKHAMELGGSTDNRPALLALVQGHQAARSRRTPQSQRGAAPEYRHVNREAALFLIIFWSS